MIAVEIGGTFSTYSSTVDRDRIPAAENMEHERKIPIKHLIIGLKKNLLIIMNTKINSSFIKRTVMLKLGATAYRIHVSPNKI